MIIRIYSPAEGDSCFGKRYIIGITEKSIGSLQLWHILSAAGDLQSGHLA